jgi:hypothetical protein
MEPIIAGEIRYFQEHMDKIAESGEPVRSAASAKHLFSSLMLFHHIVGSYRRFAEIGNECYHKYGLFEALQQLAAS